LYKYLRNSCLEETQKYISVLRKDYQYSVLSHLNPVYILILYSFIEHIVPTISNNGMYLLE